MSEQKPDSNSSQSSPSGKGGKKSFALRIDEATYKALEKWAADEFRSVNGQMEWLIDQALKAAGRSKSKHIDNNEPDADS